MSKGWKVALYLLFFGALTFLAALVIPSPQKEYSPAEILGAKTNLTLFVEPDDGRKPILDAINSAQAEILITVYLLSDPEVISSLKNARVRGVEVKIILEEHPFGGAGLNQKTKPELDAAGAQIRWSNPAYALTHQKSLAIDQKIICILNLNLTKSAFLKNREYAVCSQNQEDVAEAVAIFLADWEKKGYTPKAANLVVSPDNARGKITALIKSATTSLDIEMEVLEDKKIIDLLLQKAKTIPVRLVLPPLAKTNTNAKAANLLSANNIPVRLLASLYPHAKLIVADGNRAYVGSVNLSSQSLDQNRELGILISQPDIIERLSQVFNEDWSKTTN